MAHKHVLDTHALVWYLEGNPRLGQDAKTVYDALKEDESHESFSRLPWSNIPNAPSECRRLNVYGTQSATNFAS